MERYTHTLIGEKCPPSLQVLRNDFLQMFFGHRNNHIVDYNWTKIDIYVSMSSFLTKLLNYEKY